MIKYMKQQGKKVSFLALFLICSFFSVTACAATEDVDFTKLVYDTDTTYVEVNDNEPYFTKAEKKSKKAFEQYESDDLKRCGVAYANICEELMPTEKREAIGSVKPTGWQSKKYENVDGKYLYNRCHLIGFQLAGENANEKNLITGTRFMNVDGMLPFENLVADYVKETGNHVLYRVTPDFRGKDLVAHGVMMEAWSVEDKGDGVCFNVYCPNVQPGIIIDYATGNSSEDDSYVESSDTAKKGNKGKSSKKTTEAPKTTYIYNENTMKFHLSGCRYVKSMKKENRKTFTGTKEKMMKQGYEPCKVCNP